MDKCFPTLIASCGLVVHDSFSLKDIEELSTKSIVMLNLIWYGKNKSYVLAVMFDTLKPRRYIISNDTQATLSHETAETWCYGPEVSTAYRHTWFATWGENLSKTGFEWNEVKLVQYVSWSLATISVLQRCSFIHRRNRSFPRLFFSGKIVMTF